MIICSNRPNSHHHHHHHRDNEDNAAAISSVDDNEYLITYINRRRLATTYNLAGLLQDGCDRDIVERLHYAKRVLDRIVNSNQ